MRSDPLVSIIIPTYNPSDYLRVCLESILSQTFTDFEVIVVDDCSTMRVEDITEKFRDERMKIYHLERKGMAGGSRNFGLLRAAGDFVCFIDSDDWIEPVMLETMVAELIAHNTIDSVWVKFRAFDEAGKSFYNGSTSWFSNCVGGFIYLDRAAIINSPVPPWNKMFKRKFLLDNELFFPENLLYEDQYFFWKLCVLSESAYLIDSPLYNYRVHGQSIMGTTSSGQGRPADFIEVCMENFNLIKHQEEYAHIFLDYIFTHSMGFLLSNKYKAASIPLFQQLLRSIGYPDSKYQTAMSKNVADAVLDWHPNRIPGPIKYRILSTFNKLNPLRSFRRRLREKIRINYLATDRF